MGAAVDGRYRGRVRRIWIALAVLLLAGCSAAPPEVATSPLPPAPSPAQPGVCLDQLGFSHGPADRVCLPAGVRLADRYDADRTLIALGPAADGPDVLAYLQQTLPSLGWKVTGTGPAGLTFELGPWSGSFAVGDALWGLTVRAE